MVQYITRRLRPLIDKLPYISRLRKWVDDAGAYQAGHFYSPVPNREDVLARLQTLSTGKVDLPNICLNGEKQLELLKAFEAFYGDLPFPEEKSADCRYYYDNGTFIHPDGIFLYSFLRYAMPKRIIEVGSGFSSAIILDTVDRFFPQPPQITFVEPYPVSLKKLLRPDDAKRVTVIEGKVQKTPIDLFTSLNSGDFLFIDSSHVVKCGSDLQYLLFDVLPRLQVGVYVHFHDIFLSFEYPEEWLLKGWYWNEAYFLRAFLSNNNAWEICFFNNYVRTVFEDFIAEKMPLCMKDIGGSLYIRRIAKDAT
jgi:predicted O-methyltransferase YrrM